MIYARVNDSIVQEELRNRKWIEISFDEPRRQPKEAPTSQDEPSSDKKPEARVRLTIPLPDENQSPGLCGLSTCENPRMPRSRFCSPKHGDLSRKRRQLLRQRLDEDFALDFGQDMIARVLSDPEGFKARLKEQLAREPRDEDLCHFTIRLCGNACNSGWVSINEFSRRDIVEALLQDMRRNSNAARRKSRRITA